MNDSRAKQATRKALALGQWLFFPEPHEIPGIAIVVATVCAGCFAVLTAPLWLPVLLIMKWSNYKP